MWRHRAGCNHCGQTSNWCRDPGDSRQEILRHLKDFHGLNLTRESTDYQIIAERQCDSCLEPYLDDCTKCTREFCAFHAGDIDGLCGGCI